jgi:hypothetical protein
MATRHDDDDELELLKSLPIRSEEIGFSPDKLKACGKCGKQNAPDRAACLYCGNEFEGVGEARLDTRGLEYWEKGFNVVLVNVRGSEVEGVAGRLSSILGSEAETFKEILRAGHMLPLARLESETQADRVAHLLADLGIEARVIADELLEPDSRPVRLRSTSFDERALVLKPFNPGDDQTLSREDLALIVVGTLVEDRTESVERRQRREAKILNESQLSHDEPVVDIYSRSDPTGWRIPVTGFDFSCLGSDKTLIASDNMRKLISRLAEFSPDAKIVGDYAQVRPLLENVWPSESTRDARSVGNRVGRKDVASVVRTYNTTQWTKYSRLQWHLL